MLVVDPDQDGDNDIVWCSAHGFGAYWLEQSRTSSGERRWVRHAIDTSWSQGHAPLWADMDGDGLSELIAGKRYMAHAGSDPGAYDPMVIYRYQFNLQTKTWDRWAISDGDRVSMGLDPKVADIDNDGDFDLLASGRSGLYWLENLGPRAVVKTAEVAEYTGPTKLLRLNTLSGESIEVRTPETGGRRRSQIVRSIEQSRGGLPGSRDRTSLEVLIEREESGPRFHTRKIRYRVDRERYGTATLLIPRSSETSSTPGVVCMFDSKSSVRAEKVSHSLAGRGCVCLVAELLDVRRQSGGIGSLA